ncbi:hypothetical protein [Roseomonas sp. WA12]
MSGKTKIPDPAEKFKEGVIKFAVEKTYKAVAERLAESSQKSSDYSDQKVVADQIYLAVNIITDYVLKGDSLSSTDAGIHLIKQKMNISKLSRSQQVLCGVALTELAINAYKAVDEYISMFKNTQTAIVNGGIAGPEGSVIMGGIVAGSHFPDAINKSMKLVASAVDVHNQCDPLALSKTTKPRVPDVLPTVYKPAQFTLD